jgi:hypothetical protein
MPAMHLNKHVGSLMAILQPHKLKVTLLLDIPLLPIHSLMHILHLAIQDDLVELVLQMIMSLSPLRIIRNLNNY